MADYISRDKINEAFDSILDCADMVFEPDDHCCAADDCGRCKWLQTKNAIKKKLDHIKAADVRPVEHAEWEQVPGKYDKLFRCSKCHFVPIEPHYFCQNCGADMREVQSDG